MLSNLEWIELDKLRQHVNLEYHMGTVACRTHIYNSIVNKRKSNIRFGVCLCPAMWCWLLLNLKVLNLFPEYHCGCSLFDRIQSMKHQKALVVPRTALQGGFSLKGEFRCFDALDNFAKKQAELRMDRLCQRIPCIHHNQYAYVHTCVCLYILYIYIYMHTCRCTYINVYTHTHRCAFKLTDICKLVHV